MNLNCSPFTMFSEQTILEQFKLGRYRARCIEEQVDAECFGYFSDAPDAALRADLGVRDEDIPAFREAARVCNGI